MTQRLFTSFIPAHYDLSLVLERTERTFSGTVSIKGTSTTEGTLSLHAKDLTIETALVDGRAATWEQGEADTLTLTQAKLKPGEHVVVIGFSGTITDAMHGLYPCYYEHEGQRKELLATQFESHHAREVFPCIDEPEAKATYDVTLTTERDVVTLGNQPIAWQREENERLVTKFATTPRMSSYLLAFVVGELHSKTATTSSGVEVRVWATPAQRAESFDFALDHAVKTIEFFDEYFGVPYPLEKSDHVALPDFSSGAMENWGLVTYREMALLADPATTTIASKQYIATVVSHELSHQWFGNLVTMKWWDNLWLNESFATLMEYIAVDAIHPEWNIWLDFSAHEAVMALRRDAIDGVQSVQVAVDHPDEITSLFDGAIVYAKGARLMRMCQSYIGHEAFRAGLASYFTEFAYQNTEATDLWQHLSAASGKDIGALMQPWISQPGYPVISVDDSSLTQRQFYIGSHETTDRTWPVPLMSETQAAPELLETISATHTLSPGDRLNADDNAHFITQYSPTFFAAILARDDLSDIARLQLLNEHTLLIRGGLAKSESLIALLEAYATTTSQPVWDMMAVAFGELKKFVETDTAAEKALREFAGELARPLYTSLGWHTRPDDDEATIKLRGTILGLMAYSKDAEVLEEIDRLFATGVESIDSELRSLVLSSVVARTTDMQVITALFERYVTTASADLSDDICVGLTSAKDPVAISFLIDKLTDTASIRPQDNARWFAYLVRNRYARERAWKWMRDKWQWIETTFGGDKSYDYYPRYAAMGLMTRTQRDQFNAFFTPLRDNPALVRTIDLGLVEIDARLELLERDGEAVRDALVSRES